ncbi:hypothetical protein E2542_SST16729 [Spatholobus suberectus]|nr:hypothetical protein E2542_SST16729 [Spatholobus suberectus]
MLIPHPSRSKTKAPMAKGCNDNPTRQRLDNPPTQLDNHIHDNHSLTNSSTSTPNDPIPGGTAMTHCSGTQGSFNNCGEGSQDFRDATINSGSQNGTRSIVVGNSTETCSGTICSFNNRGSGSQHFQGAKINSGYNSAVTVESPNHFSRFARILNIGNFGAEI